MSSIQDIVTDAATSVRNRAVGITKDLRTRAQDAWDSVELRTNRAVRNSSAYVHENPVPTALTAFGVGLILGLLLHRRVPATPGDRHVAEPLHRSNWVPLGLFIACGSLLRRTFLPRPDAAGEIAENVSNDLRHSRKPFRGVAGQTGKGLAL